MKSPAWAAERVAEVLRLRELAVVQDFARTGSHTLVLGATPVVPVSNGTAFPFSSRRKIGISPPVVRRAD